MFVALIIILFIYELIDHKKSQFDFVWMFIIFYLVSFLKNFLRTELKKSNQIQFEIFF